MSWMYGQAVIQKWPVEGVNETANA